MLDFLAYQYHMLRTTYCMVSLLINTVIQEKAIEDAARVESGISVTGSTMAEASAEFGDENQNPQSLSLPQGLPQPSAKIATRRTATSNRSSALVRPPPLGTAAGNGTIEAKILARVPNPDMHCFSLPSAIPRSFDQKQLGWSRVQKNELVRVYALERIPNQLLERACIQLVLAVLTQLRDPFLAKESKNGSSSTSESNGSEKAPGAGKLKKQKSNGIKKVKRKTSARNSPEPNFTHATGSNTSSNNSSSNSISNMSASTDANIEENKKEESPGSGGRIRSNSRSRSHELQINKKIERDDSSSTSPVKKRSKHGKHSGTSPSTDRPSPLALSELVASNSSPTLSDSPLASSSPSSSPMASPRSGRRKGSSPALSGSPRKKHGLSDDIAAASTESTSRESSRELSRKERKEQKELRDSKDHGKDNKNGKDHKDAKDAADGGKEGGDSLRDSKKSHGKSKKAKAEKSTGREVLQALQDIVCEHIEWTQQGIAFTVGGEMGFSARLYSIEGPQHETALIIRVTSETFAGSSRGLRLILDNINAFVLWEYKTSVSDIFIPCSCADCLKARSSPKFVPLPVFKNAATFTFEECERAIGSGYATLPCSVYGNEVPLDRIVPDLVMSDLEMFHADYADIIKETELARSSNGIVYKGTYLGETVAIKELSVRLSGDGLVDSVASEYFADFRHEVWVSSLLKHENIVGLKAFAIQTVLVNDAGEELPLDALETESSRTSISRESSALGGSSDGKSKGSKKDKDPLLTHKSESDFSKVHAQFGNSSHQDLSHSNYESPVSTKDSISSISSLHSQSTPRLSSHSSNGSGYFSNNSTSSSVPNALSSSYQRIAKLAIVMEYIPNGDLYRWLNDSNAVIDWDTRLRIAEEIAQGMYFLHTLNPPILHHDLKSANIFIVDKSKTAPVMCRVGDFGEARTNFSYNSRERVDNPIWLAPEVMQKHRYESHADVYAFGIILWELFAREHPFDEYPEARSDFLTVLEDAIIGGLRPSISEKKIEAELPISATSNLCVPLYGYLMRECWQTDRFRRPTFARIISTLQDIRAIMTMNENRILNSELPEKARAHKRDLTATEQEWISIVDAAERANADAVTIQTVQTQNAEVKQKTESLRASITMQPIVTEQHSNASESSTDATNKSETVVKEEKIETQNSESSAAESKHPTLEPSKILSDILAEIPSKDNSPQKESGDLRSTQLIAPVPQSAVVAPILAQGSDTKSEKPLIQPEAKKPETKVEKETTTPVTNSGISSTSQATDLTSQKARVYSTMQSIVALNRRDSDTPPFLMRRGSISGSPSPSSEALLMQYSNPSALSKSTAIGIGLGNAAMGGLSLRKKLATSAMIPLNFLPTASHDDHEDSDDDDGDD